MKMVKISQDISKERVLLISQVLERCPVPFAFIQIQLVSPLIFSIQDYV